MRMLSSENLGDFNWNIDFLGLFYGFEFVFDILFIFVIFVEILIL